MKVLIANDAGVRRLLPMDVCVGLMKDALSAQAAGDAVLPLRTVLQLPGRSAFLGAMPGYLGNPESFGIKALSVMPDNHGTGYESHQGVVVIFGLAHGEPLAFCDAGAITAIRTAAASAAATDALARPDAGDLAIIGSGTQAATHLLAMNVVRPLRRVRVWSRSRENAERFARSYSKGMGGCGAWGGPIALTIEVMENPEAAVRGADLVCTTTAAPEPLVRGEWLAPGCHVNAAGACFPNTRELDTEAVRRSRLFTDCRESCLNESGEFRLARAEGAIGDDHLLGEIGSVFLGRLAGRTGPDDLTLYESLGIALEDLAAAHAIHRRALASGEGTWVAWGGPA
jgi:ornithine cyclodeaminase/alanine dehydrogenase-like protein (mu-crystallin family)